MADKTAVDTIFVGKDRAYNRRFQQMCGHYLVEPPSIVARTMYGWPLWQGRRSGSAFGRSRPCIRRLVCGVVCRAP
jgi:hypothetical protein